MKGSRINVGHMPAHVTVPLCSFSLVAWGLNFQNQIKIKNQSEGHLSLLWYTCHHLSDQGLPKPCNRLVPINKLTLPTSTELSAWSISPRSRSFSSPVFKELMEIVLSKSVRGLGNTTLSSLQNHYFEQGCALYPFREAVRNVLLDGKEQRYVTLVTKCSLKRAVAICKKRWHPAICSKKIKGGFAIKVKNSDWKIKSGIEIGISVIGPEFNDHLEALDYTVSFSISPGVPSIQPETQRYSIQS